VPIELIDPGADPLGALAQPSDHELKVPYGIMFSSYGISLLLQIR